MGLWDELLGFRKGGGDGAALKPEEIEAYRRQQLKHDQELPGNNTPGRITAPAETTLRAGGLGAPRYPLTTRTPRYLTIPLGTAVTLYELNLQGYLFLHYIGCHYVTSGDVVGENTTAQRLRIRVGTASAVPRPMLPGQVLTGPFDLVFISSVGSTASMEAMFIASDIPPAPESTRRSAIGIAQIQPINESGILLGGDRDSDGAAAGTSWRDYIGAAAVTLRASALGSAPGVTDADVTSTALERATALVIVVDVTVVAAGGTLDLEVQAKWGSFYGVLVRFAQITTVSTVAIVVHRDLALAAAQTLGTNPVVGSGLLVNNGLDWLTILRTKSTIGVADVTYSVVAYPVA